jgi:hypothetical protein
MFIARRLLSLRSVVSTKASRVFAGVFEGTIAYKAGLRNGQRWVVVVAHLPTVLAELDVQEGDLRRSIKVSSGRHQDLPAA